jgi:hypothetical protein
MVGIRDFFLDFHCLYFSQPKTETQNRKVFCWHDALLVLAIRLFLVFQYAYKKSFEIAVITFIKI